MAWRRPPESRARPATRCRLAGRAPFSAAGAGGLVLASLLTATNASGQRAVLTRVADAAVPAERAARFEEEVRASLAPTTTLEAWVRAEEPAGTVEPERLAGLRAVERALGQARAKAARLEDRDALRVLAGAGRTVRRHLDVPGAVAWLVEVELATAIVAAQAGYGALAEASLRRAATLDPDRSLRAAEARPALVEAARLAVEAVRSAPRGRFVIRCAVEGASVSVDDRPVGPAPATVEAPVGLHVLRVEAPGHRPWARPVDVLEGDRAPLRVALSPSPRLAASRAAQRAGQAGELERVAALLARVGEGAPPFYVLRVGAGPQDRALLVRCEPGRCDRARRLRRRGEGLAAEGTPDRSADPRWLLEPPTEAPEPGASRDRWPLWVGVGLAVAGAAAAALAIGLTATRGERPPVVVVVPPQAEP
ncbi:MAG: PEGA domain-containing protein [Sandaracinaceae bacterium]